MLSPRDLDDQVIEIRRLLNDYRTGRRRLRADQADTHLLVLARKQLDILIRAEGGPPDETIAGDKAATQTP